MKHRVMTLVVLILSVTTLLAQIPERPGPPRLVNDLAGVFTQAQVDTLELRLIDLDDSTSNQIAIVTVSDLGDYDKVTFAHDILNQWGVGVKGKDNGVVILVKPKTEESNGQVFIATGYGLEGAIPDMVANMIINKKMIPNFINNDYYAAVSEALDELIPLAAGEYTVEDFKKRYEEEPNTLAAILGLLIFFGPVILFLVLAIRNKKKYGTYRGPARPTGTISSSGRSHSSGYSSGRSHSSGSSGRSFGGFGGGRSGGGGAGGSW